MSQEIDITTEQQETVRLLLARYLPNTEAWVYGSRARWTSRPDSDLDMVVFATPDQARDVSDLREAFEESNLPFYVDLFVWEEVQESFREQIEREHVVLTEPPPDLDTKSHRAEVTFASLLSEPVRNGVYKPKDFHGRGVKMVNMGELFANPRLTDVPMRRVELTESEKRRFSVQKGDLLFARRSLVAEGAGKCCVALEVPESTAFESSIIRARPDPTKSDPLFLYYYFASPAGLHALDTIRRHVAVAGITGTDLANLSLVVPPPRQQQEIARVLGTLDDKIELNLRMSEALEEIVRTTFRDWFVDFGPTRAKAEGRASYLVPELWELFPNALDDEGKPVGWTISEIGNEVQAVGGGTPSTKEASYWEGGEHHWATPKDLSKLTSPVLLRTAKRITEAGVGKIGSGLLPVGTVLLSSRAPIGYLAIAEVPTAVNQGFIAMVCQKRLSNTFVLFWCRENLDHIKDISGGSTFAEISKRAFRPIPVVVPSQPILAAYDRLTRPLYVRIVANAKENNTLAEVRDVLLPKLMSGEARIADAEKAVEAAA